MAIFLGIGTGTWIVFVNYFWEYFGKDDCSLVKYRTQSRPKLLTSKSAKKAGFRSFLKINKKLQKLLLRIIFSIKLNPINSYFTVFAKWKCKRILLVYSITPYCLSKKIFVKTTTTVSQPSQLVVVYVVQPVVAEFIS